MSESGIEPTKIYSSHNRIRDCDYQAKLELAAIYIKNKQYCERNQRVLGIEQQNMNWEHFHCELAYILGICHLVL